MTFDIGAEIVAFDVGIKFVAFNAFIVVVTFNMLVIGVVVTTLLTCNPTVCMSPLSLLLLLIDQRLVDLVELLFLLVDTILPLLNLINYLPLNKFILWNDNLFMVEVCSYNQNIINHCLHTCFLSFTNNWFSVTESQLQVLFIQTSSWYNFQLKELWDQSNKYRFLTKSCIILLLSKNAHFDIFSN